MIKNYSYLLLFSGKMQCVRTIVKTATKKPLFFWPKFYTHPYLIFNLVTYKCTAVLGVGLTTKKCLFISRNSPEIFSIILIFIPALANKPGGDLLIEIRIAKP